VESVSTSDALIRPWRTATIVVSTVAVVELVLILAIATAVFGGSILDAARGSVASPAPAAEKKAQKRAVAKPAPVNAQAVTKPAPAAPELRRGQTKVLVLNGNGIAGAAAAEGTLVQSKGYRIAAVGNAERTDYARSVVMYRPGFKPEAWRLARDLRVRTVSPLDGLRVKDLSGAHVAIVLGG
jgi:hypothetical protein